MVRHGRCVILYIQVGADGFTRIYIRMAEYPFKVMSMHAFSHRECSI